jgi:hypothetical protein
MCIYLVFYLGATAFVTSAVVVVVPDADPYDDVDVAADVAYAAVVASAAYVVATITAASVAATYVGANTTSSMHVFYAVLFCIFLLPRWE